MTIPRGPLLGLAAIIAVLSVLWGVGAFRAGQGHQAETQSAIHQGEAQAHAQAAHAIPDHSAAIARAEARANDAEARVVRERAKVARLEQVLQARADQAGPASSDADQVAADLLAAKDSLIEELDGQVVELKTEVGVLKLALTDEQKRSSAALAAYEAERKATAALRVALSARPPARNWSVGARIETLFDGRKSLGATARRDIGVAYVEVSGFSDRAGFGFGWRF